MSEESVTIELQPTDDTETILEKVRTTKAQQINLIVPPGTQALQTLGGFTMLRKACDITSVHLTVYSEDEKTCDMAEVCRFDVVRLGVEMPIRPVFPAEEEELPRIVVSTRPPEPIGVAAEEEAAEERPPELEARLEGLSEEDLALFDAFESMSITDEAATEAAARPAPREPVPAPEVRVARPRERREPKKASFLQTLLYPLTSALGNLYIAVVGLFLRVASRFQPGREAEPKEGAPVAIGPRARTEEETRRLRLLKQRYYWVAFLSVVTVALLILTVYWFSLPRVTVVLTPLEKEAKEMDLNLTILLEDQVSKDAQVQGEGTNVAIPAKAVQVEMSGQASAPASGQAILAEGRATGAVVLTNLTESNIFVPAGTTLSGGGATFHTTEDVNVPASNFWGSGAYVGMAQVGIIADQPGSAYNVDAWVITTIEGNLAGLIRAVNELPTTGGSERQATVVTQEDLRRLEEQLIVELQDDAYAELQKQLGTDLAVLTGTLESETVEKTFDHEVGSEAETVMLTARVRVSALASRPGLLEEAIRKTAVASLGGEKSGQTIGQITHGALQAVGPAQGASTNAWTYTTHVRVPIQNVIDRELKREILRKLAGLRMEEAYELLEDYRDRIAAYAISPAMGKLPSTARIRVVDLSEVGP